eukprot:UN21091
MGFHYFNDLATKDTSMSWVAENMMPIVPMYANGVIQEFFFASTDLQQTVFPPGANEWEPVGLPNILMCKNWCDDNCGWKDTSWWSTMHIYLKDRGLAKCAGGCTTSCCDKYDKPT